MHFKDLSLGKKILIMFLGVSLAGLLFCMIISLRNMVNIKNVSLASSTSLGNSVADKSEAALVAQMQQNILTMVNDRSSMNTQVSLQQYLNYCQNFAAYTESLYAKPEHFLLQKAEFPKKENLDVLSLQLTLENGVDVNDIMDEASLLANVKYIFDPVISDHQNVITSIYLASERGFMLSYDTNAASADSHYFDFKSSSWYSNVREQQKPIFTDVYVDSLGRGLMTTCTAPFYDADGSFAGVICLDMQLEDIYTQITNVDVSENSVSCLLDKEGSIVAGPGVDYSSSSFQNVSELTSSDDGKTAVAQIISGNEGVTKIGDTYIAYAPIESINLILVIQVPESDIIEPITEIRKSIDTDTSLAKNAISNQISSALMVLFIFLIFIAITIIFISYHFSQKLVSPILKLNQQVGMISAGNLDSSVEVESNDEIGSLAAAFNDMSSSLKSHIEQIQQVTAEKERIGAELSVATHIQASMLPSIFPAFPHRPEFDIYATMAPAKEVGGDFYDFFLIDDDHLAMVIADVSGKGIPAALFMVIAKTLIKDHTLSGISAGMVFTKVNHLLCETNDEGMFVTAWMGILEISTRKLEYVNAGHNPPFIAHEGNPYEPLHTLPGLVLAGLDEIEYQSCFLQLSEKDALYLYTDGITEATDCNNTLYGESRLQATLNKNRQLMPAELLSAIDLDVSDFVKEAPQFDDMTMLGFRFN